MHSWDTMRRKGAEATGHNFGEAMLSVTGTWTGLVAIGDGEKQRLADAEFCVCDICVASCTLDHAALAMLARTWSM